MNTIHCPISPTERLAAMSAATPPAANQMPHNVSVNASTATLMIMTASQIYRLSIPNIINYPLLWQQYSMCIRKSTAKPDQISG